MKLDLSQPTAEFAIQSVALRAGAYQFRVADAWHRQSLIVAPQSLELWNARDISTLTAEDFARLGAFGGKDFHPEMVLLGTGQRMLHPEPALTQSLMAARIGLEVMDTPAACRTYNLLASDGRQVVAGLLA